MTSVFANEHAPPASIRRYEMVRFIRPQIVLRDSRITWLHHGRPWMPTISDPAPPQHLIANREINPNDFVSSTSLVHSAVASILSSAMSKNRHAFKDYHGPRLAGTQKRSKHEFHDDDDDDENPLRALAWTEGDSLAPPCGSSVPLIHAMLEFASVNRDDVLYDLGCGDGRVILEGLVMKKCRQCVGVELEPDLVERCQKLIEALPDTFRQEGPPQDGMVSSRRIQVVPGDLRDVLKELVGRIAKADGGDQESTSTDRLYHDLPMPTVIVLYLLPEGIAEIEEDLMKLLPRARIVCCSWGLKEIRPIVEKEVYDRKTGATTTLYLYTNECFERLKGFEYMLSVYNHGHSP